LYAWLPASGCFGTAEEYKDKEGHLLLKRTYNIKGSTAEMLSTYYVYDDLGHLAFVLPPGASPDANAAISQSTIDTRCYQYRYDTRGRLFQKKVPGRGWEFMIYNTLDQVVGIQDSVQRMKAPQEWTVSKYDNMGRPVIMGILQYGATAGVDNHVTVQGLADAVSTLWETTTTTGNGYTANAWPATLNTTLNVSYYDVYTNIPGLPANYFNAAYTPLTMGMQTATKNLVLNTTGDYLWTVPYYDKEGKVVRTYSQHYLGGSSGLSPYNYDDVSIGYNFVKQVTSNYRVHYISNAAKTARIQKLLSSESYSYDHMGRRRSNASQLQDSINTIQGAVRVSLASYNETGQLIKKGLHSINGTSNFLQNLDYRYNPRGWLSYINNPTLSADGGTTNTDLNDQFGMELKYDNATSSRPQYNGNIATTTVKTGSVSGTAFSAFTYDYRYDKLNRLNDAVSTTATTKDGFHSEYATYDNMGNITNLGRYDKIGPNRTAIDTLTYTYIGNRVDRIDDASAYAGTFGFTNGVSQAGEYTYDGNGNQLKDLNKGLTGFTYNLLNLPQTVTRSNWNTTVYVYDATGRKLRKLFTAGTTTYITEYINGIQYDYSGSTPVIAFIQTEEGRARKAGAYVYEYDLKDHLGNTRITTTWDPADATQLTPKNAQHTDYYAFGYTIQSLMGTIPFPKNEYLYNGKELQEETGLYDYGARFYDPVIGRWNAVDPMTMLYPSYTPYAYSHDNPAVFNDPNGMDVLNGFKDEWEAKKSAETNLANVTKLGDKKAIKDATKSLKQANKQFEKVNEKFQATENLIAAVKQYDQPLFEQMDNLKDAGGTSVDVVVRAVDADMFSNMEDNSSTDKLLGLGRQGEGIALAEGQRNDQGSLIFKNGPSGTYMPVRSAGMLGFPGDGDNKASVYLRIGQDAEWLAHEFGHLLYTVGNMLQYYKFLLNHPTTDGHGAGDPSGKSAEKAQSDYRKLKSSSKQ